MTAKQSSVGRDLWVLAGQSNMVGAGRYEDPEAPSPHVHVYDDTGRWRVAADPLIGFGSRRSIGLGVTFGKTLHELTGAELGLIPCARGSTCLEDWSPERRDSRTEPLYQALLRRVRECGGRVRGVVWYQGESDATPARAARYHDDMAAFVARLRQDLGRSTPFIFVQIGRVLTFANDRNLADHTPEAWDTIRQTQERLSHELANCAMTTAVDLELENKIHISAWALKAVGRRLALLAARRCYRRLDIKPGPRIRSVRPIIDGGAPCLDVICNGVNGELGTAGRPSGFSVTTPDGADMPIIKTRLRSPRTVRLYLHERVDSPEVWYGRGIDPYCNIEDAAGLALPATGPVRIGVRR